MTIKPNGYPDNCAWQNHIEEHLESTLKVVDKVENMHKSLTEIKAPLDSIDDSMARLEANMTTLMQQHRDVLRWLLAVVCAIAVGKGALEIFDKVQTGRAEEIVVGK